MVELPGQILVSVQISHQRGGPGNSTVLVPFVFLLCSPPLHDLARSSRGIRVWLGKREWSRLKQILRLLGPV